MEKLASAQAALPVASWAAGAGCLPFLGGQVWDSVSLSLYPNCCPSLGPGAGSGSGLGLICLSLLGPGTVPWGCVRDALLHRPGQPHASWGLPSA